jgi:hypothetical protein
MMVRWALIKADDPAGAVYGGVVASEPWEAKDNVLVFFEVSYLKSYLFVVVQSLKKDVNIKFNDTTSVFGTIDVPYSDWGFQSVKLGLHPHCICMINEQTHGSSINKGGTSKMPAMICWFND